LLNSFLKKYWVGLLLIAIFSIASYFNLIYHINSQINDSKHINVSGQQRMLSQQIALLATKYYINGNMLHKSDGLALIEKFKNNHNYLIEQKLSDELYKSYFKSNNTDKMVKAYISNSTNFFKQWDEKNYIYILENSEVLLLELDKIVTLFQKHGETNREKLINIASLILVLTIIILILEAKFIFIPIQKENNEHTISLKNLNTSLEEKVNFKTQEIRQLLESVGKHVIISKTDSRGLVTYCSDAFCSKTGFSREKLLGHEHPVLMSHKIDKSELFASKNRTFTTAIKNRTTQGTDYWLDVKITPIMITDSQIKEYLFVCYDKTEEMKSKHQNITLECANKELETLASTCALTSIYNRRIFENLLNKELLLLKRYPIKKASLIFMDIDHFKEYGHLKGDEVLIGFSENIDQELRGSDVFARWGGEEFAILLKDTSLQIALDKAEHLRKKVETYSIASVSLTCSFGVVELDENSTIEKIIKQADDMMYLAKKRGRNKVVSI
jgi:diguanylate cyclase (GGDEF)-like protein/PAS domain S-box-containing protein